MVGHGNFWCHLMAIKFGEDYVYRPCSRDAVTADYFSNKDCEFCKGEYIFSSLDLNINIKHSNFLRCEIINFKTMSKSNQITLPIGTSLNFCVVVLVDIIVSTLLIYP